MKAKISIITATYNSIDTLKYALESLNSQTYKNVEHIIIDGGSTDGTVEWLENNQDKFSKWISEKDKGIYDALNKGIKIASGDIIGFMHADDFYAYDDVLQDVVTAFEESSCELLYGDLEYVSSQNIERVVRYWHSGDFKVENLKRGWMPPHPTVYFKREVVEKYGGFDLKYKISADYEWLLRVLKDNISYFYLEKVMVKMRVGGASNKGLKNIYRKSKEDYIALKSHNFKAFFVLLFKNLSKINQFFIRK